jgi:rhomboid family GlyGly-CTERM serine protease
MMPFKFSANMSISLFITLLIVFFAAFPDVFFPWLSLERNKVAQDEVWRILTSNFVHFGWAHTLMNLAAFLLCSLALFINFSAARLIALILFCSTAVGLSVYIFNPEYETYAGLSGAIHGFIIAGLLLNKRHTYWLNGLFIALAFGKIIYEHQANYHATELQALLPVAVAYDAHLYGALAGLLFGAIALIIDYKSNIKLNKSMT